MRVTSRSPIGIGTAVQTGPRDSPWVNSISNRTLWRRRVENGKRVSLGRHHQSSREWLNVQGGFAFVGRVHASCAYMYARRNSYYSNVIRRTHARGVHLPRPLRTRLQCLPLLSSRAVFTSNPTWPSSLAALPVGHYARRAPFALRNPVRHFHNFSFFLLTASLIAAYFYASRTNASTQFSFPGGVMSLH